MFVDSHCHLNLSEFNKNIDDVIKKMSNEKVFSALVASVDKNSFSDLLSLVSKYDNLWGAVGAHPECLDYNEFSIDDLCSSARHNKIVAIGETGLDYYRENNSQILSHQRERFRNHIRAALVSKVPLIVHTRSAALDTINILKEERASEVGGVIHCFTENWEIAKLAMDLNFLISISGIVTFKNADLVRDVAKKVPLDMLLIETDSPYLSPVPHRGEINNPSNVVYVAQQIASLRNLPLEDIANYSSNNFFSLFKKVRKTKLWY